MCLAVRSEALTGPHFSMEVEERNRQVAVCLIGAQHGAVEDVVQRELAGEEGDSFYPGETLFLEYIERDWDDADGAEGMMGLESDFYGPFSFLSTMIIVSVSHWPSRPEEDVDLPHGEFHARFESEFARGLRGDKALWDAMPMHQRAIYYTADRFFEPICQALEERDATSEFHNSVGEYFSGSSQAADTFESMAKSAVLGLRFTRRVKCQTLFTLVLEPGTMPALFDFIDGFKALLLQEGAKLRPPLQEAASIVRGWSVSVDASDFELFERFSTCFSRMRDEDNWHYVMEFLARNPGIERIVLIVGNAHLESLAGIIARHNATGTATRFNNVVEIECPELPDTASESAVRLVADQTLKKVQLWRELCGYNGPSFRKK